ncbi:MAG: LytTR family DNA-binding domain-containing protein [Flavobacteriaceae bacterium]|tara:strand:- start:457 stop:1167 length:711 start_codon:yes stop_codon:yes gene_type:complete
MNCIIVDDQESARLVVRQLCAGIEDLDIIEEFSSAIEAIKFLNQQTVDVIFLDIHMPGFSGFDFVQTIKNTARIVLITSDKELAIEAYEYESISDYLVKPITQERFNKSILKVKNTLQRTPYLHTNLTLEQQQGNDLYINIDRRLTKLKFDDILFIKAKGDYIDVKTHKEVYCVHSTLKKIKDKLPDNIFLQTHRSYIINFTKIIDIEDNSVLIEKNVIPISRSNRPELIRRLNLL